MFNVRGIRVNKYFIYCNRNTKRLIWHSIKKLNDFNIHPDDNSTCYGGYVEQAEKSPDGIYHQPCNSYDGLDVVIVLARSEEKAKDKLKTARFR